MILPLARWHDHPARVSVDDVSILLGIMPEWECWRRGAIRQFLSDAIGRDSIEIEHIPKRVIVKMVRYKQIECQACGRRRGAWPTRKRQSKSDDPLRSFSSDIFDALVRGQCAGVCGRCRQRYETDSVTFLAKQVEKNLRKSGRSW